MQRQIRKDQIKRIHTLLSKLDLVDEKQELVHQASNGRCTSTKDLLESEADAIIWTLQPEMKVAEDKRKKMVNKLLYYGYEMGFDKPVNSDQRYKPSSTVNFENVSNWCAGKKCAVGKQINDMNNEELNQALSQFEQMYKKTLNRI